MFCCPALLILLVLLQAPQTPVTGPPPPPQLLTTTDVANALRCHASFAMWKPAADTLFQMMLASDPDGAQCYQQLMQARMAHSHLNPKDAEIACASELSAFNKSHAGKLYRALTLERKIMLS